jgi:hypothetical protein
MNTSKLIVTEPTVIRLRSGFQSGARIMHITGIFPDFRSTQLAAADECTWHDDADTSKDFVLMPDEARALFLVTTWGVSAHSREARAVPLTPAAEALCQRPLPKGWAFIIPGHDLGGATTKDDYVQEGTLERYLCNLAAGRRPSAISPAQRREVYEHRRLSWIAAWNVAGLNGRAIWDTRIPWAKEAGVIELAAHLVAAGKAAGKFLGYSRGHKHFTHVHGYRSPLSHPRTSSAEWMAELSI